VVRRSARGSLEPGEYTWVWDGRDEQGRLAGSGAYFFRLQYGNQTSTSRLVLVR
jgi:flagellar hook assembly protein FlgD